MSTCQGILEAALSQDGDVELLSAETWLYRIAGHKAMACNDFWVKITSAVFRKVEKNVCKRKAKKEPLFLLLSFHEIMKMFLCNQKTRILDTSLEKFILFFVRLSETHHTSAGPGLRMRIPLVWEWAGGCGHVGGQVWVFPRTPSS